MDVFSGHNYSGYYLSGNLKQSHGESCFLGETTAVDQNGQQMKEYKLFIKGPLGNSNVTLISFHKKDDRKWISCKKKIPYDTKTILVLTIQGPVWNK